VNESRKRTQFNEATAARYRPKAAFVKTAILLTLADGSDVVRVSATFGVQHMRGDFYVVASESGSYAVARKEFEKSHEQLGPHQWAKRSHVDAYRTEVDCEVETILSDGTPEVVVPALPGDWIVRQATGEIIVVAPAAFERRYEPAP